MKSIENFTVLNTWALLVDFLNEHWFIVTATTTESSFVLSWSSASVTRQMKAQDTKRTFKPHFPNFPAIRPKEKFFERRKIWHQNAPNSPQILKTIGFLGKHLCVTRNCAFSLPEQTTIGIIPTRKADPNIFLIALKQDCLDAQYVKLPYSM